MSDQSPTRAPPSKKSRMEEEDNVKMDVDTSSLDAKTLNRFSRQNAALGILQILSNITNINNYN